MSKVSTIGLDIAKSVFQVHGVDVAGAVVIRKRVSRAKVLEYFGELPPCLVGIEACPSAHHWGRELAGNLSDAVRQRFGRPLHLSEAIKGRASKAEQDCRSPGHHDGKHLYGSGRGHRFRRRLQQRPHLAVGTR
jgi:hypothetical protein